MRPNRRPSLAVMEAQVKAWNDLHPVGTEVAVTRDNGRVEHTKTRSEAWVLSGHTAVIMVEGISGCYLLDRVKRRAASDGDN